MEYFNTILAYNLPIVHDLQHNTRRAGITTEMHGLAVVSQNEVWDHILLRIDNGREGYSTMEAPGNVDKIFLKAPKASITDRILAGERNIPVVFHGRTTSMKHGEILGIVAKAKVERFPSRFDVIYAYGYNRSVLSRKETLAASSQKKRQVKHLHTCLVAVIQLNLTSTRPGS
jgi:hypothetical protein